MLFDRGNLRTKSKRVTQMEWLAGIAFHKGLRKYIRGLNTLMLILQRHEQHLY